MANSGTQFTILSQQLRRPLRNNPTYDINTNDVMRALSCVENERIQFITQVEIYQFAKSDEVLKFTYETGKITRNSGSFISDGFYVGSTFVFNGTYNNGTTFSFTFVLNSISNDGLVINITENAGVLPPTNTELDNDSIIDINLNAQINAFKLKFGIIENNETFNTISKLTDEKQEYYSDTVDAFSFQMTPKGIHNSWVDGGATIELISSNPQGKRPVYEIVHTFIVNSYREAEISNIINNIAPLELSDEKSTKLVYNFAFGQQLNDPNSFFSENFDSTNGSVGWYDETMNGFDADYKLDSVAYNDVITGDSVTSIQSNAPTRATISIARIDGNPMTTDEDLTGFIFKYFSQESEYQNTDTDFEFNLMFSDSYQSQNPIADNFSGVITSHTVAIVGGKLVSQVEISLPIAQQLRLNADSQFLIAAIVGDKTKNNGASNVICVKADVNSFILGETITGLVGFDTFNFIKIGENLTNTGTSELVAWNEDGFTTNIDMWLDLSKDSVLTALSFKLVAYNSVKDSYFELDTFTFDLSDVVISNGIQQIEINTNRGYSKAYSQIFNDCTITTGVKVGDKQHYIINFAQKITWQDWIKNDNVDLDFYDNSELNNNLNYKASNYSGVLDYDVFLLATGSATGTDTNGDPGIGLIENFSGVIDVNKYGKDTNPIGSEEWNLDSLDLFIDATNYNTSLVFDSEKQMRIESIFSNNNFPITETVGITVIHRLQPKLDISKNTLELTSNISVIAPNKIKAITIVPIGIIQSNVDYDLTARIQRL